MAPVCVQAGPRRAQGCVVTCACAAQALPPQHAAAAPGAHVLQHACIGAAGMPAGGAAGGRGQ